MEAPRRIPRKGFSSVHQHDPRVKRDVGMRRSYAARQDHTYVEMLNRGLAMAQRKLDRGEGSQEVVDMWARRLKANQQANPGGAPQTKSQETQSTEINMDGYERIYEMFINEVAGGTPSHKAPGHAERMEAHKKRIRSHPEFSESNPKKVTAGKSGGRPSKKAKKQEADTLTQQFRSGTVSQQRGK